MMWCKSYFWKKSVETLKRHRHLLHASKHKKFNYNHAMQCHKCQRKLLNNILNPFPQMLSMDSALAYWYSIWIDLMNVPYKNGGNVWNESLFYRSLKEWLSKFPIKYIQLCTARYVQLKKCGCQGNVLLHTDSWYLKIVWTFCLVHFNKYSLRLQVNRRQFGKGEEKKTPTSSNIKNENLSRTIEWLWEMNAWIFHENRASCNELLIQVDAHYFFPWNLHNL